MKTTSQEHKATGIIWGSETTLHIGSHWFMLHIDNEHSISMMQTSYLTWLVSLFFALWSEVEVDAD